MPVPLFKGDTARPFLQLGLVKVGRAFLWKGPVAAVLGPAVCAEHPLGTARACWGSSLALHGDLQLSILPSFRPLLRLSPSQCADLSGMRTKVPLLGGFLCFSFLTDECLVICGPRGLCQGRLRFKHWSCRNSFSFDSGAEEVENRLLSLSSLQQGPKLQLLILLGWIGFGFFSSPASGATIFLVQGHIPLLTGEKKV